MPRILLTISLLFLLAHRAKHAEPDGRATNDL